MKDSSLSVIEPIGSGIDDERLEGGQRVVFLKLASIFRLIFSSSFSAAEGLFAQVGGMEAVSSVGRSDSLLGFLEGEDCASFPIFLLILSFDDSSHLTPTGAIDISGIKTESFEVWLELLLLALDCMSSFSNFCLSLSSNTSLLQRYL